MSRAGFAVSCACSALALAGFALAGRDDTTSVAVHEWEWQIALSQATVPTGTVVFTVTNDGSDVHDFSILGHTTPPLAAGQHATLTVTFAQPGRYEYVSTRDDVDVEMNGVLTVTGAALTTAATTVAQTTASSLPLTRVADVPLPDGSSRFDYQSLNGTRLYIAHLGAGTVAVVDTRSRKVVGDVHGVPGAHGVLAVPSLNRVFATATDSHKLVAIRGTRVVASAPAGDYPDGLAFDPVHARVFVSDEHGDAEVVVDARHMRQVATIPLGGEAGNVQYDPGTHRMLAAVAGREQLVGLKTKPARIVARHALPGCKGAHGVHLDPARRLAFVACEDDAKLLVFDLRAHRVTQTFDVGDAPDVLDLDPGLHRLYVAAESGEVAVFEEQGRGLKKLGQDVLAPNAHSVAVDPATHLVYFPLEDGPVLRVLRPSS
jgi:DNA-binding beta-propeller fold protein YncE/plastocyanin